ncbi:MAG: DNA-deoxyinosine glycosylase [Steroidobacteraceae bacterium]
MRASLGFPPVYTPQARVLILGSLPGPESLRQRQYYAQPRNAFWRLMGDLYGAGWHLAYEQRLEALRARRVALWDVCRSARRPGALDQHIDAASVRANDFASLYEDCPTIERICFNGQTAARLYRTHVLPGLDARARDLPQVVLPSSSPAHASLSYEAKLQRWAAVAG